MKSVASRLTYEVRPFQDEDTSQVLNLLTLVLGSGVVGERSLFRWKHVDTPFGRSFMLVAERGGRIIGFRAFMRWQLSDGLSRQTKHNAWKEYVDPKRHCMRK